MTKRWSSTRSMDGKTKRQASKDLRTKAKREPVADNTSIADRMLEAQLQAAMGGPVDEDWLLDCC